MPNPIVVDHNIVCVLVTDETNGDFRVLLVEEARPGREGLFNLPGGHIERHESLHATAVREVWEEAGYVIEVTGVVGYYQGLYDKGNYGGFVLAASVVGGTATGSAEHPTSRWATIREVEELRAADKLFAPYVALAVQQYATSGCGAPFELITTLDNRT